MMKRREFVKSATLSAAGIAAGLPFRRRASAQQLASTPPVDPEVKRVLMIFKCHLDVGFTDTQANVMGLYFKQYYPQAMQTAAKLRDVDGNRYVWTGAAWLLYEYLEQASSDERKKMESAIAIGDIAWHALPFSWQTEMLDRSMIEGCLGFSNSLDTRFGRKTTAGKMTDVPCHSRGIVSPLAGAGVRLLDIGVNPASTPPEVPDVFLWKAPDGSSLAVLYHKHDYGSTIRVPGSDLAVSVNVRVDNSGPHSIEEINAIYAGLHQRFPNAQLMAGSLTDIATAIEPLRESLSVVTQELGDTWIYGAPSDPPKIARYREISRLRKEWITNNKLVKGGPVDQHMLARLTLASEHTWGTDTKRYIDHDHYSPKELAENLNKPGYQTMERSWQEKRDDVAAGISSLPAPLRTEAEARLQTLQVTEPTHTGMKSHDEEKVIHTAHFEIMFDSNTGAITRLVSKRSGRSWASTDHPLALFTYQTLTQDDYKTFLNSYVVSKEWWAPQDFGKPNIERFQPESRDWHPKLENIWVSENAEEHRVLAKMSVQDPASETRGLVAWPRSMYLELVAPKAERTLHVTFYVIGKAPNRMPESMWLTFKPQTSASPNWIFEKVDQEVSASDVVRGGGRSMHAVTSQLSCVDGEHLLDITTLDAPVVALGRRSPLNFSKDLPDLQLGAHVNLFNNAWGTNYPQWAGGDWRYRFTLIG
jgi:Domain of unknown function (DUF5054)